MSKIGVSIGASALVAAAIVVIPAAPAFASNPSIGSVSPSTGSANGGDVLTITGTGFDDVDDATVDGNTCTNLVVNSDNLVHCTTPPGNPGGPVDVMLLDVADGLDDTASGAFTYVDPP